MGWVRVVGYLRVSTREQADSRLGLDAQRRAIREEASRRGWDLTLIEDAGYTAKDVRRPGLDEALRLLRRHEADVLVVSRLDRLSRSVQDFARLLTLATKQRWRIAVLDMNIDTTTPNGRLVANILMAVAAWEGEMISARTADAMAEAKAKGHRFGRPRMTPDGTVARIHEHRREGLSFAKIARALDADHIPTPHTSNRWHPTTVARIYKATS